MRKRNSDVRKLIEEQLDKNYQARPQRRPVHGSCSGAATMHRWPKRRRVCYGALGLLIGAALLLFAVRHLYAAFPARWRCFATSGGVCTSWSENLDSTASIRSSIPKILHYVFKDQFPFESYKPMIRSCLSLNPGWKVYLWRDSDSSRLIREQYTYFADKFKSYRDRLEKSDSVRYMILHKFGGIYLDMDVECLRPFDQLLSTHSDSFGKGVSAFLGEERREQTRILYGYSRCTMNSLMGSSPGHPFFHFVIQRMLHMPDLNHARLSTGPDFLTRAHNSWVNCSQCQSGNRQVAVFPAQLVSPLMDTSLVSWEKKCEPYFKVNSKSHKIADSPDEEAWRRLGCSELVAKAWRFDDTDALTVTVHRFTHQGYGDQRGKRTFNLLKEFPRVQTHYETV